MNSSSESVVVAPFQLEPMFVPRVWGSIDLRPWYEFVAAADPVGEVWLTGDSCKVTTGPLAGRALGDVFAQYSESMLGKRPTGDTGSPLLLKVIFAREKLSVQVHPDDRLAQKYGQPRGKTECWYALAADPGAEVAAGLRPGVTLEAVEAGVNDHTLEESLKVVPVEAGDMVYVDAGTVHAIWPGSVLLETQQNCDITYRLYDYGRPRELHVAKALEATRLETEAGKIPPVELSDRTVLIDRQYFRVEKMIVNGTRSGASMLGKAASNGADVKKSIGLTYLFAAAGEARVVPLRKPEPEGKSGGVSDDSGFEPVPLLPRGIVAIPASSPAWQVEDLGGLMLIRITPCWPESEQQGAPSGYER